jgi:hypothetical protein
VNKLRWGKFFWSDWADDPALALCSLAAQGLWMRLLCIAAQGTPYGHVNINGKPPSMDDLAKLIRPKPRPTYVERLVAELERYGVVERDETGCLVSRRMEADGRVAMVRREAARQRWQGTRKMHAGVSQDSSRTLASMSQQSSKPAEKAGNGSDLHMQNSNFASVESEAEAESRVPPVAPPRGGARRGYENGGGRRSSRNAAVDMLAEELDAEADDARPGRATVVPISRRPVGG